MSTQPLINIQHRVLALTGECTPELVDWLIGMLLRLDAECTQRIYIHISCRNGHAMDGLRLADAIAIIKSPVTALGMGLLEGPGLIAFLAAEERHLLSSTLLTGKKLVTLPILPMGSGYMGAIGELDTTTPDFIESHVRIALTRLWSQRGILRACRPLLNEEPVYMTAFEASRLGIAQIVSAGAIRQHAVPTKTPPPEPTK